MRNLLVILMALVVVFFLPLAGGQELYCSDIITPWGGDKEIPGKIKWGMSKAETKQILMRTEKQPVEEFPNKLIMKIGTDTITTYTYFFTNNDELAIVEKVRSSHGSILYSSYIDIFKKIHGNPESICFDHDSTCWSIRGHGLELKHNPAEDTLTVKTYHRQFLLKYTEQKIERLKKAIKQAESPVDKKGATLPDKKDHNAYELLTPRMKEKVRLKVLKDFAKHPEKYRIEDGTIHLRPGANSP